MAELKLFKLNGIIENFLSTKELILKAYEEN